MYRLTLTKCSDHSYESNQRELLIGFWPVHVYCIFHWKIVTTLQYLELIWSVFLKQLRDFKIWEKISRNIEYSCIVQIVKMKNMISLRNFLNLINSCIISIFKTGIFCFDTITEYKLLKTMATFQNIIVPIGTCILHLVHVYW